MEFLFEMFQWKVRQTNGIFIRNISKKGKIIIIIFIRNICSNNVNYGSLKSGRYCICLARNYLVVRTKRNWNNSLRVEEKWHGHGFYHSSLTIFFSVRNICILKCCLERIERNRLPRVQYARFRGWNNEERKKEERWCALKQTYIQVQ